MGKSSLCAVALALLFVSGGLAQQAEEWPELAVTEVTDGLYMLSGRGGNLGLLVGDDAAVLIDDQFAPVHPQIREQIDALSPEGARDRTFVLNTHFHGDHTGGNELLGEEGSIIVAHERVRTRLSVEQIVPFFNMRSPALEPVGLPVVTFHSSVGLHLNGEDMDVIHWGPAHTDGDSIVHFTDSNVIHAGDLVFYGTYPFIDLDNGGTVKGFIEANERILDLCDDDTKIIPGHGPLLDKEQMEGYVEMLQELYEKVAALVSEGMTLEEIQAVNPTAKYDEAWSTFIQGNDFVSFLVRDLAGE